MKAYLFKTMLINLLEIKIELLVIKRDLQKKTALKIYPIAVLFYALLVYAVIKFCPWYLEYTFLIVGRGFSFYIAINLLIYISYSVKIQFYKIKIKKLKKQLCSQLKTL